MRFSCFFAVALAGCLRSTHLLAQATSGDLPAELAAPDLERALRDQAGRARTWRYTWTGINGALTVLSFAPLPWLDRSARPDFVVSGIGSAISTALTLAFPLAIETDEAKIAAIAQLPLPERSQKLREILRQDAADERARVALPWHALNLGVSALAGGLIVFGFQHTASGIFTGAASFVLGEAQLVTQPTGLVDLARASGQSAGLRFVPRISYQSRRLNVGVATDW